MKTLEYPQAELQLSEHLRLEAELPDKNKSSQYMSVPILAAFESGEILDFIQGQIDVLRQKLQPETLHIIQTTGPGLPTPGSYKSAGRIWYHLYQDQREDPLAVHYQDYTTLGGNPDRSIQKCNPTATVDIYKNGLRQGLKEWIQSLT